MPRFNGVPVTEPHAEKPRFGGTPAEQSKVRAPVPDSEYVNNREPGFVDKLHKAAGRVFSGTNLVAGVQALDDMVRLTANGMLFGWADRLAGEASEATGIGGGGLEQQRALTAAARERAGSAGTVAEIGGGMATLGGLARIPGVSAALGITGRNIGTRAAMSGVSGAGLSTLQAAGEGRDPLRAAGIGGAAGLMLGPAGELAGRGFGRLVAGFNSRGTLPAAFADASQQLFKEADDAGLKVSQSSWAKIVDSIQTAANKAGFSKRLQPKVQAALEDLSEMRGKQLSLTEIEQVRRFIRDAAKDPDSGRVLGVMVDALDDALGNLKTTDVIAGDPSAVRLVTAARTMWRKAKRLETLQEAFLRAGEAEGAFDNALRSEFRKIRNRSDFTKIWTPAEQVAIRHVAGSKGVDQFMTTLGKINGFLMAGGGGFFIGGGSAPIAGILAGTGALGAAGKISRAQATKTRAGDVRRLVETGRLVPESVEKAGTLGRLLGISAGATTGSELAPEKKRKPSRALGQ
ncbi:hypothetical protein I6F15_04470 [Bradyrhizobium sp. BRP14]|nr:hypothetical protein [Bradyrhizobium sp. BRP14]